MQLTMYRLQAESPRSAIDRAWEANGASWYQRLVWVREVSLMARSKAIDLWQRFRKSLNRAVPERSDGFQSGPLGASCSGMCPFGIH